MDSNRERYNDVRNFWFGEVEGLLARLAAHDENLMAVAPKDTVHRINNNRKFQPDLPLYKSNFAFTPYLKIAPASFHLSISPTESFTGGGLYRPPAEMLAKVRRAIDHNGDEFHSIVTDPELLAFYGGLDMEEPALASAPKGYSREHPHIKYLRMKSFISIRYLDEATICGEGLFDLVEEAFVKIKPLIDYLNRAINYG